MKPFEITVAYHYILRRTTVIPSIVVATAFYRHIIIAVVKVNILDEYASFIGMNFSNKRTTL